MSLDSPGISNLWKIKKKKLIFIHSLFRTGSTYVWSKFREHKRTACYYEPLNEKLLEEEQTFTCEDTKNLRHFFVTNNYFSEYTSKRDCTRLLKKKLIIDEFAQVKSNKQLKKYIECLYRASDKEYVILQFNRTALRVKWFHHNLKKGKNICLYRNHRDQWQSIFEQFKQGNPYFLIMNLMIVSKNLCVDFFRPIDSLLHIPYRADIEGKNEKENFQIDYNFFYDCFRYLSVKEHYFIHYYLWRVCLDHNKRICDICVDMTKLSESLVYRKEIQELIKSKTGLDIDFSDVKLSKYKSYDIEIKTIQSIEREVERILAQSV